jgi:cellulose synthase/poly-beta-1,6-N-acetylglucosamine synthase-like glycosyltransferase
MIETIILSLYFSAMLIIFMFSIGQAYLIYHFFKARHQPESHVPPAFSADDALPVVTIQLPIYNELYVVRRLIQAVSQLDYPQAKLEIQILDDSTDETTAVIAGDVKRLKAEGLDIAHIRRGSRAGFKAGALQAGLCVAKGEFIAIFDADFVPDKKFLRLTIPHFTDERLGMVQTRWGHLNENYSLLTKAQAFGLNAHFGVEQQARNAAGLFINFNGTAGVWRKSCIADAGGWQADTLTEDLDLSYRCQLRGWRFKFLNDVSTPSELPAEMQSLKSQQFRWTKGAIETSKKILPKLLASTLSPKLKLLGGIHLLSNMVFVCVFVVGLLSVPVMFVKQLGTGHVVFFNVASLFAVSFMLSGLFYAASLRDTETDWPHVLRRLVQLFPMFIASSMGLSLNNSVAVVQGLWGNKSAFVRTPKFNLTGNGEHWQTKKYIGHLNVKNSVMMIAEMILTLYYFFGVCASIYFLEISLLPFLILSCLGFGLVSFFSVKHFWQTASGGDKP